MALYEVIAMTNDSGMSLTFLFLFSALVVVFDALQIQTCNMRT